MLDTVLMNRLDGDAVGPVKVLVSNPFYSHDHQHVLIPDGTVVLGEAKKIGTAGFGQQRRMAVVFHRLIMPDGYSVDLDQFHGLDQIGEEGLKDKVNNHYLLELRLRMRESSHSGEIRELLEAGWNALGLPMLVSDIDAGLALRESEMRSADSMRATRVGWVIAIVFGIVAVPGLADQLVTPAWHVMKMHPIVDPDKMKLLAAGIASCFILTILTLSLSLLSRRRRRP